MPKTTKDKQIQFSISHAKPAQTKPAHLAENQAGNTDEACLFQIGFWLRGNKNQQKQILQIITVQMDIFCSVCAQPY